MAPENTDERTVRIYEPVAEGPTEQQGLAPRLATLEGRTIGLLDNTKDRVEVLLDAVRALLQRDFPGAQFRYFRKESVSGAAPAMLQELAACDAVVTGIGD